MNTILKTSQMSQAQQPSFEMERHSRSSTVQTCSLWKNHRLSQSRRYPIPFTVIPQQLSRHPNPSFWLSWTRASTKTSWRSLHLLIQHLYLNWAILSLLAQHSMMPILNSRSSLSLLITLSVEILPTVQPTMARKLMAIHLITIQLLENSLQIQEIQVSSD